VSNNDKIHFICTADNPGGEGAVEIMSFQATGKTTREGADLTWHGSSK